MENEFARDAWERGNNEQVEDRVLGRLANWLEVCKCGHSGWAHSPFTGKCRTTFVSRFSDNLVKCRCMQFDSTKCSCKEPLRWSEGGVTRAYCLRCKLPCN